MGKRRRGRKAVRCAGEKKKEGPESAARQGRRLKGRCGEGFLLSGKWRSPPKKVAVTWGNRLEPLTTRCDSCGKKTEDRAAGPNTKGRGGADGDRTHDLVNAIHALSQLSYSPAPVEKLILTMGSNPVNWLLTPCRGIFYTPPCLCAGVVKLVDALDSKSSGT